MQRVIVNTGNQRCFGWWSEWIASGRAKPYSISSQPGAISKLSQYSLVYVDDESSKLLSRILVNGATATFQTWNINLNTSEIDHIAILDSFNMRLHTVRIYDRALTQLQQSQNYNIDKERFGIV